MKKIIIIAVALLCAVAIAGYKLYNKSHRSVEDEEAIIISAIDLFNDFKMVEEEANKKYLDKVIEVNGIVSEVLINQDGKSVIVFSTNDSLFGVNCTMEKAEENIKVGSALSIKGICTGYLSDVVLTRGIITRSELKIK